jgi:sulfite exporter TauE/SafE
VAGAYLFGFATMPGLLAVALLGQRIHAGARRWLVRASGVALVIFGVLTLVRGEPRVHAWFHEHLMPGGDGAGAPHGHHGHHEHHGHQ